MANDHWKNPWKNITLEQLENLLQNNILELIKTLAVMGRSYHPELDIESLKLDFQDVINVLEQMQIQKVKES